MSQPDQLLTRFREAFIMDEEWSVQDPGILRWWGGPQPLILTADEPVDVQGDPTVRITAFVDLFTDVPDTRDLAFLINLRNTLASTGALILDPERSTVTMFCTYYAHADNEPVTTKFPAFALLMYTEALALAQLPELAELCGSADSPAHPVSGIRADFDELIGFTDTQILPAGQQASRWGDSDGDEFAQMLANAGNTPHRSGASLTAHFPFLDVPVEDAHSTLILEPRTEHPNYGSGLLALVKLPAVMPTDLAVQVGGALNIAEFKDFEPAGRAAIGAWCAMPVGKDETETSSIAHDLFLPNYFHGPGWTTYLGVLGAQQSAWGAEQIVSVIESLPTGEDPDPA